MHYLPKKLHVVLTTAAAIACLLGRRRDRENARVASGSHTLAHILPPSKEVIAHEAAMNAVKAFSQLLDTNNRLVYCADPSITVGKVLSRMGRPFRTTFGDFEHAEVHKTGVRNAVSSGWLAASTDESDLQLEHVLEPTEKYWELVALNAAFGQNVA